MRIMIGNISDHSSPLKVIKTWGEVYTVYRCSPLVRTEHPLKRVWQVVLVLHGGILFIASEFEAIHISLSW